MIVKSFDAKLAQLSYDETPIVSGDHPAVISAMNFKQNQGTLEAGLVVAVADRSAYYVAYDPAANDGTQNPKGVLLSTIDTSGASRPAPVLEHGTAVAENVHVSGTPVTSAQIEALKTVGIYCR